MKMPFPRAVLAILILGISAVLALSFYSSVISSGGNDHQAGDWLISYPDGFIRRGLFGEILLTIGPSGPPLLWLLFAIQVSVYVVIFAFFIRYLIQTSFSWSAIALVCSPAALPFIGWDPLGGFRKEILGFLALVLLAFAREQVGKNRQVVLVVASLLVWTVGVFSWESLAFLLPGVGYLLLVDSPLPWRKPVAAIYTAIGLLALGASAIWHGGPGTATALCDATTARGLGPQLCTGAFAWMGRGLNDSLASVTQNLAVHSGYLVVLALAALPIALSPWLRIHWRWAIAALMGILPLFVLGIDYGRWIHILVIELSVCIAVAGKKLVESSLWNPLSVGLYVSLWGVPHAAPTPSDLAGWPFRGLAASVITSVQSALLRLH